MHVKAPDGIFTQRRQELSLRMADKAGVEFARLFCFGLLDLGVTVVFQRVLPCLTLKAVCLLKP